MKTSILYGKIGNLRRGCLPPIRVSPARFYDPTEDAMTDIKRCAELEKANS